METTIYQQTAIDFLKSTGVEFSAKFVKNGKHFADDKEERDIYEITLKRGQRKYSFEFGRSLNNSGNWILLGGYESNKQAIPANLIGENGQVISMQKLQYSTLYNPKCDKIRLRQAPTGYDILARLTKNDPCTFEDFCSEYGYDRDSIKALKVYEAVKVEYAMVCALWSESELEQLQEIN